MKLVQVVPPEPALTLEEAKLFLRVDHGEEDALIAALVAAAGAHAERVAGRAFGRQEWEASVAYHPWAAIRAELWPLVSVAEVRHRLPDGTEAVLDAGDYRLDAEDAILPVLPWPDGGGITARLVVGQGWTEDVRQAVRTLVAYWYDHRSAGSERMAEAPMAFGAIIGSLRRVSA